MVTVKVTAVWIVKIITLMGGVSVLGARHRQNHHRRHLIQGMIRSAFPNHPSKEEDHEKKVLDIISSDDIKGREWGARVEGKVRTGS